MCKLLHHKKTNTKGWGCVYEGLCTCFNVMKSSVSGTKKNINETNTLQIWSVQFKFYLFIVSCLFESLRFSVGSVMFQTFRQVTCEIFLSPEPFPLSKCLVCLWPEVVESHCHFLQKFRLALALRLDCLSQLPAVTLNKLPLPQFLYW